MRRKLLLAAQTLASLALLAWIFREPEFRCEAASLALRAQPAWTTAAAACAGLGALLGLVRWGIFLRMTGIRLSVWQTLRIGAVGLFFNNFLPGAVGGDAVKAGWLAARGYPLSAAALSAVMDRLSGLGALIGFSAVFMGLRWQWLSQSPLATTLAHTLALFLAGTLTLLGMSFAAASRGALQRLPSRLPGRAMMIEWGSTYGLFLCRWRLTSLACMLSGVMLALYFLTFYASARALGVDVPLSDFFAIMPIVDVAAALPVSLGGLGVREGIFVTLLGQLSGVPAAEAVSLSLLGALVGLFWGSAGLLLLPAWKREAGAACSSP